MKKYKKNTFGAMLLHIDSKEAQQEVKDWNEAYKSGTPVIVSRPPNKFKKNQELDMETTTRSEAFLAIDRAHVFVNGCADSIWLHDIRLNLVELRRLNDTEGLAELHKPQPKQGETKGGIDI